MANFKISKLATKTFSTVFDLSSYHYVLGCKPVLFSVKQFIYYSGDDLIVRFEIKLQTPNQRTANVELLRNIFQSNMFLLKNLLNQIEIDETRLSIV